MKVLFFGDSNTYGYDPSDFLGGRYPASVRWADRLAERLEGRGNILAAGQNGRCVPAIPEDVYYLEPMLQKAGDIDVFACMLGTNDVWLTQRPDAAAAERHMDAFLSWLKTRENIREILLIAPPAAEVTEDGMQKFAAETKKLPALYRQLAEKHNVKYVDADQWHIPMGYDGVHFSEEGHRIFAEKMYPVLQDML